SRRKLAEAKIITLTQTIATLETTLAEKTNMRKLDEAKIITLTQTISSLEEIVSAMRWVMPHSH
ncbi:hypothetical protein LM592_01080, partial [Candidatus Acetothermia bacterium]|nr:hypothetical protein [Candidatus Acetothermia bacterium]